MLASRSGRVLWQELRRDGNSRRLSTLTAERKQRPEVCPLVKDNQEPLSVKPFESIPGPRMFPVIGTQWQYFPGGCFYNQDEADVVVQMQEKYGDVVRESIGKITLVRLFNPADFVTVYYSDLKSPMRPGFGIMSYYNEVFNNGKHGLLNGNGSSWLSLRRTVQSHFMQPGSVATHISSQDAIAQSLVDRVTNTRNSDDCVEDLIPDLYKFAIESMVSMCFGIRLGAFQEGNLQAEQFIDAVNTVMNICQKEMRNVPWYRMVNTPTLKMFTKAFTFVRNVSKSCLNASSKPENQSSVGVVTSLRSLIGLDEEEFSTFVSDMLFASVDTTGHSLAFVLYQLSINPQAQQKVFAEVKDFGRGSNEEMGHDLRSMVYLRSTIKETLRMMPVVPSVGRFLTKDISCSGYQIPAGTMVSLHHGWAGKQTRYFEEAEEFLPERWMKKKSTRHHPYALLPFGFGPRSCIGQRVAMQELSLAVIRILQKYKVTFMNEDLKTETNVVTKPSEKLCYCFKERRHT